MLFYTALFYTSLPLSMTLYFLIEFDKMYSRDPRLMDFFAGALNKSRFKNDIIIVIIIIITH